MAKSNHTALDFRPTHSRQLWLSCLALTIFYFVFYGWLKAPDIVAEGDSGEIVTALHGFGIIHSPGFPGYVVTAKLFCLITPWMTTAQSANLFSAFTSALTLGLLFALGWKIGLRWFAFLPCLALSISLEFWYASLMTEVYSLSLLTILAVVYYLAFANFFEKRSQFIFGFLFSFGISVHVYIWALVPILFFAFWKKAKPIRFGELSIGLILGLFSYIYIPLRANKFFFVNEGGINSFGRFFDHVSWILQRERINPSTVQNLAEWIGVKANQIIYLSAEAWQQWGWITIAIVVIAFFGRSPVKDWRMNADQPIHYLKLIATMAAIYLPAVEVFVFAGREFRLADMGEMAVHLLPLYLMISILFAVGLTYVLKKYSKAKLFLGILGLMMAIRMIFSVPQMNLQTNFLAVEHGKDLLEFLPPDSILIGDNDNDLMPTIYLTGAKDFRRDVAILNMSNGTQWYFENLRKLYPQLKWSYYSPLYLLTLVKAELDSGRSIFFSNNYAALTFLNATNYKSDVSIVPRLGAYQLILNSAAKPNLNPDPNFHFRPEKHSFKLRGTEVDFYGGRADYHLQRTLLLQSQKAEISAECAKGKAFVTVYDSQFNNEINKQLSQACQNSL